MSARRTSPVLLLAVFCLLAIGIPTGLAQIKSQKRITSIQVGETGDGSRVTILSDSALNDYEAFRRGDSFYIKIPQAGLATKQPNYSANGFDRVVVDSQTDSVLISFKLQPGVTARVDQRQNRLDIFFNAANKTSRNAEASPSTGATTSNSIPGIVMLPSSQRRPGRSSDAAGFLPPDSPAASRPRIVKSEPGGVGVVQTGERNHLQLNSGGEPLPRTNAKTTPYPGATRPNSPASQETFKPAVQTEPTPSLNSANSLPATSPYPTPSRQPVTSRTAPTASGWKGRTEIAKQWVAANRITTLVAALILISLVGLGCVLVYRSRRTSVTMKKAKLPGVKPKYQPQLTSEEQLDNGWDSDSDEFGNRISESNSALQAPAGFVIAPPVTNNGNRGWTGMIVEPEIPESDNASYAPFQTMQPSNSIPVYALRNEETEREVFEL